MASAAGRTGRARMRPPRARRHAGLGPAKMPRRGEERGRDSERAGALQRAFGCCADVLRAWVRALRATAYGRAIGGQVARSKRGIDNAAASARICVSRGAAAAAAAAFDRSLSWLVRALEHRWRRPLVNRFSLPSRGAAVEKLSSGGAEVGAARGPAQGARRNSGSAPATRAHLRPIGGARVRARVHLARLRLDGGRAPTGARPLGLFVGKLARCQHLLARLAASHVRLDGGD